MIGCPALFVTVDAIKTDAQANATLTWTVANAVTRNYSIKGKYGALVIAASLCGQSPNRSAIIRQDKLNASQWLYE